MLLRKASILAALVLFPSLYVFSQDFKPLKERTIQAQRIQGEVKIDGVLDEPAWQTPGYSDFVQSEPIDGSQPTERTVVWIGYDDKALYVAARLFDSEPGKIVKRLGRKDTMVESDWFEFAVDPYFDRLSGYVFYVNPSGSIVDGTISKDTIEDDSWDGVWHWAARIDDKGWTVEIRIPYNQLRFPKKEESVWGVFFRRIIKRKNEKDDFVWIPKEESGFVSRFAKLEGVRNISPPRHIEILPYIVGQGEYNPPEKGNPFNTGKSYSGNFGADLKVGLASNLTLDATINPDFGQVEVDPAVVNLTAYETFYQEKRPFFIEGAGIFNFGQGFFPRGGFLGPRVDFFYSRRIGRYPEGNVSESGYVDFPTRTTILGAAKISGKISSSWNLGFLSAITAREYADIALGGHRSQEEVEPLTYYGVLRSSREFNEGKQGIGIISTAVVRDLRTPELRGILNKNAFALGVGGWTFLGKEKTWIVNGWFGGSRVEGSKEDILRLQEAPEHYYQRPDAPEVKLDPNATSMNGWAGQFSLNKTKGNVLFNACLGAISPGLETNDLGYQFKGDAITGQMQLGYAWFKPGKLFRDWKIIATSQREYDFGGNRTFDLSILRVGLTFLNYWGIAVEYFYSPKTWDNSLTRGGCLALALPHSNVTLDIQSDARKSIIFHLGGNFQKSEAGSHSWTTTAFIIWNPRPNISLTAGPSYMEGLSVAQWVTQVRDRLQTQTYGSRYVFADIIQNELTAEIQLNWTFTPRLTLQMYLQPFLGVGKYSHFKELARPRSFDFNVYGTGKSTISYGSGVYTVDPDGPGPAPPFSFANPDFNFKSLRGTTVLRWEFAPGSSFYFVWTQNRADYSNPGEFRFGRDLGELFRAKGDNIFLIKFSYLWNY